MMTYDKLTNILNAIQTTLDEASRRGFVSLSKDLLTLRQEIFVEQQQAYKSIFNAHTLKNSKTP